MVELLLAINFIDLSISAAACGVQSLSGYAQKIPEEAKQKYLPIEATGVCIHWTGTGLLDWVT